MNTTKCATTVREPNAVEPRPLEGLRSIPKPPADYTPDYFVNEFAKEPTSEFVGYSAPAIERPGYTLQRSWTPEEGLLLWIDHNRDEAFTVPQIRDLIATLTGLPEAATEAPEV